jgi:hypothetical protein
MPAALQGGRHDGPRRWRELSIGQGCKCGKTRAVPE